MVNEIAPPPAVAARALVRRATTAALATLAATDGWAYPSLVQVATDAAGRPLLLLSDLAEHTKNVKADGRVGLLFDATAGLEEPLTGARLSLLGRAAATGAPEDRARYLARFPSAALFADFKDFRFYRVEPERAHLVAGFGRIHGVAAGDLRLPDDLARAAAELEPGVVRHMNQDHADAVRLMAERLIGVAGDGARLCGFDAEGCDIRVGAAVHRVAFPAAVGDGERARATLAALARRARGAESS
ncbi:MAG: HugZ family protein [Alphaproteobacteria bacterium]